MKYLTHQIKYGKKLIKQLNKNGYAYLVAPPRAGKTLTALYACEHIDGIENIIIITPKNAISGWLKFIDSDLITKNYNIFNIESIHKISNINKYDIVIWDEAHKYGGVGKPSKRYTIARKLFWNLPQLLISATPLVEGTTHIYYQMTKSKYSPFSKFKNFYRFFDRYGIPKSKWIAGREIRDYTTGNDKLLEVIKDFTIEMPTQIEAKTKDKIHYLDMPQYLKDLYNKLRRERYLQIDNHEFTADSVMRLRMLLHQLEGGTLKDDEGNIYTFDEEYLFKIKFIKETFGDKKGIGIMCHFKAERKLIRKYLKNVEIYSSNAHAEGVDLSHLKTFIIYSQDYSGAKHIQRRERILNMQGSKTLTIQHLLVKNAISYQVYNICSKKRDFNNATFKNLEI